jgi:hemerythrin-like domain-containing protein
MITTAGSLEMPVEETLRSLLGREHAQLRALLENVLDAFESNNEPWAAQCYEQLERGLGEHLELEEDQLFPVLAVHAPTELAALRSDHAKIREHLATLGVSVDLHAVRATQMKEFARLLDEHARREDSLAYRYADAMLFGAARSGLVSRIRERIARLAPFARTNDEVTS